MDKAKTGGSAFPTMGAEKRVGVWTSEHGLTIRDYFAIRLPDAVVSEIAKLSDIQVAEELGLKYWESGFDNSKQAQLTRAFTLLAQRSYLFADAMVQGRKPQKVAAPAEGQEVKGAGGGQ